MEAQVNHLISLQHLGPRGLALFVAPFRIPEMERVIIPELALRGRVRVIVGGRGLDADVIMRAIRARTPDAARVRERVRVRRAPTAFSMRALLQDTTLTPEPVVILDLLTTFYDPNRALWESCNALQESITELGRLKQLAPVVVTVRPPPAERPERARLLNLLLAAAERVFRLQCPPAPSQLTLF